MTRLIARAASSTAAAFALCTTTHLASAQTFVGPTRSSAASGCASGSIAYDPVAGREVPGIVVCAQGTGTLGYTQLSGLTLLTLRLDLTFTPGPSFPSNSFVYPTNQYARLEYSGAGCTTGPVCSAEAINSPISDLQFFPPVSSVGSVDLSAVNLTAVRVFFDYNNSTIPGFEFSSTRADLQLSAVPEPSPFALSVGGLVTFAAAARRRKRPVAENI